MNQIDKKIRDDGAYVFHHPPKFAWTPGAEPRRSKWQRYTGYVHVPFCRKICTFCTFERKKFNKDQLEAFVQSLKQEFALRSEADDFSKGDMYALYLGGGTASLLKNEDIGWIVNFARQNLGLAPDAEVTLECEPGTKTKDDFKALHGLGINRISIGVQSFNDTLTKSLNRSHGAKQSTRMIEDALGSGFRSVHVDLMYGLPGQRIDDWNDSLERAIGFGIQHLSAYRLIVFQNELLSRSMQNPESEKLPDSETIDEMRNILWSKTSLAGLAQYSLTEFCQPGHECQYVSSNWNGSDYLGFGVAAYSRNGHDLWENTTLHNKYHEDTSNQRLPIGKAVAMTNVQSVQRDLAMGLCLLDLDVEAVEHRLLESERGHFHNQIKYLTDLGILDDTTNRVRLTQMGQKYATHAMKTFTFLHPQ